jgi:hypothetical protein
LPQDQLHRPSRTTTWRAAIRPRHHSPVPGARNIHQRQRLGPVALCAPKAHQGGQQDEDTCPSQCRPPYAADVTLRSAASPNGDGHAEAPALRDRGQARPGRSSSSTCRAMLAPHGHADQTKLPSTPASRSPHRWCSVKKASSSVSRLIARSLPHAACVRERSVSEGAPPATSLSPVTQFSVYLRVRADLTTLPLVSPRPFVVHAVALRPRW